jgi:hypothetical protein
MTEITLTQRTTRLDSSFQAGSVNELLPWGGGSAFDTRLRKLCKCRGGQSSDRRSELHDLEGTLSPERNNSR